MQTRYRVILSKEERDFLDGLTKRGTHNARKTINARALLLCDTGPMGPAWSNSDIIDALGISERAIVYLKKRFIEEGLHSVLERKRQNKPKRDLLFDSRLKEELLKLVNSQAPEGRQRWTVRLLASKIVELKMAPHISPMTVHRVLKKMNLDLATVENKKASTLSGRS